MIHMRTMVLEYLSTFTSKSPVTSTMEHVGNGLLNWMGIIYIYLLKLLPSFFRVENIIDYYFHHKGKNDYYFQK